MNTMISSSDGIEERNPRLLQVAVFIIIMIIIITVNLTANLSRRLAR